ncbi:hypothetical protein GOV03_01275 [Candidatus Woesearchaeota archaeon]|nr:hypothetical protein [Candidatus Woesearchaeota archaeon]
MKNLTFPTKITSLLAEEIGLHLGDGSMNYYNDRGLYQLRGHLIDDKKHYNSRIKFLYKKLFNLDLSLREMPSCGVYGFQIWSNELVDYKSKVLNLPLGKKLNFSIPPQISSNNKLAKSFLRGYFDTDGCLYIENKRGKPYPRIEMASISKKFIEQLKIVLKNLGYNFGCYKENREKQGWQNLYRIIIRGEGMAERWFSEVKPQNPKHLEKFNKLKMALP